MSLRDELAKFAACPEWLDETIKIVERALAAERAATISALSGEVLASHMGFECRRRAHIGKKQYNGVCAWCLADRLEIYEMHDRSALDKMLVQALAAERAATIEECTRAAVAEWWDTIDEDVPRDRFALDQAVQGSAREAILAQARREQQGKDAAWLKQCADKFYADDCDAPARTALRIAAENILAQAD